MGADRRTSAAGSDSRAEPSEQWRAVYDHSPLAIAYVSSELRLLQANSAFAALCGRAGAPLPGRHCYELLGEAEADGDEAAPRRPCSFCRVPASLSTGGVWRFERPFGPRTLRVVASPVRDAHGRPLGAALMIADVTAERELRRQLVDAQKLAAIGLMTSGVAHELKNPLTSIVGFTQLLRKADGLPEGAKDHLEQIWHGAQRCERIVGNLLKFARRRSLGKGVVDLNRVVRESLELLRYHLSTSGIAIHEQWHPTMLATLGDFGGLQQVVLNIVTNAFDAMREARRGGTLTVRTRRDDTWAVMEFENDGPPLADPEKVFTPFYTTKDPGNGTGLGLSVSAGIVRDHGGTIRAANTPRGVLFRVALPPAHAPQDPSLTAQGVT